MILVKLYAIGAALFLTFWLIIGISVIYLAATEAWPAILAGLALAFLIRWKKE